MKGFKIDLHFYTGCVRVQIANNDLCGLVDTFRKVPSILLLLNCIIL
jgi:hypothetical protein